jgi:hypothetical protein
VIPCRSLAASTAALAVALVLAACNAAQPAATGSAAASPPAATSSAGASPPAASRSPDLTPVPGGSTATSAAAASQPTQTDTEWGRIWDALPASLPLPPDAVPTETGEGPASGSFAVGDTADHAASFMQTALAGAGFATESLNGPSEDGSYTLNALGEDPACAVQVTARPLSGTTNLIVLYGAACPWQ